MSQKSRLEVTFSLLSSEKSIIFFPGKDSFYYMYQFPLKYQAHPKHIHTQVLVFLPSRGGTDLLKLVELL